MAFQARPLAFKPPRLAGLSARLMASHYENNYGGAIRRLNAIRADLAGLNTSGAPGFLLNGLKREELIAANSMLLHELYFDGLGGNGGAPEGPLDQAITRDFGSIERWRAEFTAMGVRWAAARAGSCWRVRRATAHCATSGPPTTRTAWPAARRSWRSTCTSTPIIWTLAPTRPPMSKPS